MTTEPTDAEVKAAMKRLFAEAFATSPRYRYVSALARDLGVNASQLNEFINGTRPSVPLWTILRATPLLGTTPAEFFRRVDRELGISDEES